MRRFTTVAFIVAAALFVSASSLYAQASQWRITPFVGGSVIGEIRNPQEGDAVEFDNGFTIGLSGMYRKGHFGLELQGHFVPTEATSASGFVASGPGEAVGDTTGVIFIARQNNQNLWFGSLNAAYFAGNSWGPDQPFIPREWYLIGGVGLVRFANIHPAKEEGTDNDLEGWDSGTVESMFNLGAGIQFNVLNDLSIQFEFRDYVFQAIERNASLQQEDLTKRWHNNFVLRQGVTFVVF